MLLNQVNSERSTLIFDNFSWQTKITDKEFAVSEVKELAQHFKNNFHHQTKRITVCKLYIMSDTTLKSCGRYKI
jgi:hypothetical protein